MRAVCLSLLIFLSLAVQRPAYAAGIGVSAPLTGELAILGRQIADGAQAAANHLSIGADQFLLVDDRCSAEGGTDAANRFVAAGIEVVVGFLCTEAIEAALPILSPAGIAVITPAVRTNSLTENRARTGWNVFRTAPRADAERAAVEQLLLPRWRQSLFALVDDGTIYGRELIESFRLAAENAGLKAVFVDTFRPQMENQIGLVGRLRRAGATHVLVGGDHDDVAIIGRDAGELGYDLTIAAGETLRAAASTMKLAPGTLMVALPEPADIAKPDLLRYFADEKIAPDGYVLPAYAAVEIAAAARDAAAGTPAAIPARLREGSFDTALGTIDFDENGELAANPYRLFRFDGNGFVPVE